MQAQTLFDTENLSTPPQKKLRRPTPVSHSARRCRLTDGSAVLLRLNLPSVTRATFITRSFAGLEVITAGVGDK